MERPRCQWNSTAIKRMRKQWKPGPFLLPFSGLGTRLHFAPNPNHAHTNVHYTKGLQNEKENKKKQTTTTTITTTRDNLGKAIKLEPYNNFVGCFVDCLQAG